MLDEIFGPENFVALITLEKTSAQTTDLLSSSTDYIIYYAKHIEMAKYRQPLVQKQPTESMMNEYAFFEDENLERRSISRNTDPDQWLDINRKYRVFSKDNTTSNRPPGSFPVPFEGRNYTPGNGFWKTGELGFSRLNKARRLEPRGSGLRYVRFFKDFPVSPINNIWSDVKFSSRREDKTYVVQTSELLLQRCIVMSTDPGDLVLDPTCGSGTTATVAEQWGRRWITIDTSRVALALARTRIMASRYPYYFLADSRDGRVKEQAVSGKVRTDTPTYNDVRHGFVYERAPHVTLKSIANNAEIDVIWEEAQQALEPLRARLNAVLMATWEEWQIPRDAPPGWPADATKAHAAWWEARIERQRRIDASIARKADIEFLYDRPYEDKSRIRVAGPFTVESLSPHRVVPADEDELVDLEATPAKRRKPTTPVVDFAAMVLDNLRTSGVHQTSKADSIHFTSLTPWPGDYIGAEGRFMEGDTERRAGILIGPEFGTLSRPDLVTAAREASEARFDVLIACAFNYDAHATELTKLGPMPILKARMNPDLHMADDLKNTGKGNLFVVFGEPDLVVEPVPGQPDLVQIRILGVDVFDPQTGDIRSGDTRSIAAWFIDTDYNEESFYVRHAYFLGAKDPYKSLKTALRAEIDEEAWATLYRDVSRPFARPESGRVAVKVINHFGDEVMKVFSV